MTTEHIQQKISRLFNKLEHELDIAEEAEIAPPKFYCPPSISWAWRKTGIPAATDDGASSFTQSFPVIEQLSAELEKAKQREALLSEELTLMRKHQTLQTQQNLQHADADSIELAQLKKNEMLLKSEIIRLQQEVSSCSAHSLSVEDSDQFAREIERLKKSEALLQEQLALWQQKNIAAEQEISQLPALRTSIEHFKELLAKKEAELFELTSSTSEFLNKVMAEQNQIGMEKKALEEKLSVLQKEHENLRIETNEKQMQLISMEEKIVSLQRNLQTMKLSQSAAAASGSASAVKHFLHSLVNWLRKPVIQIEQTSDEDEE